MKYIRKRCGRGFTFQDRKGNTVTDRATRDWLRSLPIPPAWTEVEIAGSPRADLLATGRDDAGRKQYLYSESHRKRRDEEKYKRVVRFGQQLETMRRVTGQHLRHRRLSREKVLACMVRLLDLAYFRPGNPYYARENDSYGLTTLRSRHLTIEGDELIFRYRGKAGVPQERHVVDPRLAKIVAELDDVPGYEIFKYFDQDGNKRLVQSADLNAYIKDVMGEAFTAKDFRTWAGTMIAALALDELGAADLEEVANQRVRAAIAKVAQTLGNTEAVARASYVAPQVVDHYFQGVTAGFFVRQIERRLERPAELSLEEMAILKLLKYRIED